MALTDYSYTIPPGTRVFNPSNVADIVKATAERYIANGKLTNLLSDLSEYALVEKLLPKHKKVFDGGLDWTFNVAIGANNSGNGTAKFTGLFENDDFNRTNVLVQGKVSPRFLTANYIFDLREKALNRGIRGPGDVRAVVDYVKLQLELMFQSSFDKLETALSGSPTYADDAKTPHGLAFYIQKQTNADAASHTDGAFDGKDPVLTKSASESGTTQTVARCGISSSTYSRWANWAAQYSAITKEDLVRKMRIASHKINFKSPISLAEPTLSTGRSIMTTLNVLQEIETILESQNMNLGNDVASKDGKTLFKGTPVEYVPILDGDARDPIYMIDWKTLCFGTQSGWERKISAPTADNAQHNTMRGFLDMSVEMACTNLRNQAVISKAAA